MLDNVGTIVTIIAALIGIALSVAGCLAAITYSKQVSQNGKTQADSDTITSFERELGIMKQTLERMERENKDKDKEISRLSGRLEELSKENCDLKNTLALRDPEFNKIIQSLADTLPKLSDSINTINKEANARYDNIMLAVGGNK